MNTKALRQKILDLAIHGKLVPQDPNDEPASVLLERIRAEKERLIKEGKIKKSKKAKAACDKPHYEYEEPFDIPSSWIWCTLGELCYFLSRGKSPKYMDEDRTYPVFAQKCNLKDGGISLEQARFLDPATVNKWSEDYKLRTGDVLVNSTGTGTVGRTRLFNEICLGQYPFVVPDSHVSVIRTFDEISSEFVYAYLSTNIIQEYLADNLAGSTNQKELYIGVLENLPFPLPTYNEQQRIVSEIDKWFCCIENVEQNKTSLSDTIKIAKSKILNLAIHGKLVPQDPNDEPAAELLKRINPKAEITCDTPQYGKLPKGWCSCTLKNVCSFTNGFAFSSDAYKNNGIPLVRISNITNEGRIDLNSCVYIQDEIDEPYIIEKGDLLVAMSGATTGKMGVYTYGEISYLNQRVGKIKASKALYTPYMHYLMYSQVDNILKMAYGGAQPNISAKAILAIRILLPPLAEQHRIVAKIEEIFAQLDKIESSL